MRTVALKSGVPVLGLGTWHMGEDADDAKAEAKALRLGLARFVATSGTILEAGAERSALAPLLVAALRIDPDMAAGLARAGLKTIGDLISRPRAPLAARYSALLLHRLDQATGLDAESITPGSPVPPAVVNQAFAEPIVRQEDIATVSRTLSEHLCADLEHRGEGARSLCLSVFRVDGVVRRINVGLAETCRDPAVLHGLLALRLSSFEVPRLASLWLRALRAQVSRLGRPTRAAARGQGPPTDVGGPTVNVAVVPLVRRCSGRRPVEPVRCQTGGWQRSWSAAGRAICDNSAKSSDTVRTPMRWQYHPYCPLE